MKPRLLILTAGFGEGHNAAARAIAGAWTQPPSAGVARVVDVLAEAAPRLNRHFREGYLGMINRFPRAWSLAYRWIDRSTVVPHLLNRFTRERHTLGNTIADFRPDAICSTYPVYGLWLKTLAEEDASVPPYFNVVTDSISINSLWRRGDCTAWFAPNVESAEVLHAAGLPRERIAVSGFPVAAAFRDLVGTVVPPDLDQAGARPRVLHMVHSGTRGAAETASRLMQNPTWELTFAVGRDAAMRERLSAMAQRRRAPTHILGWTDEIPRLLFTHHVVISKAGGATTQEALAAGCPMIVTQIVPGQEEGNFELLRRHQIGGLATSPAAVIELLERAFADRAQLYSRWRTAAVRLGRPEAASIIVDTIRRRIGVEVRRDLALSAPSA